MEARASEDTINYLVEEVQRHMHRVAELQRQPVVDLSAYDDGCQPRLQEVVGLKAHVRQKLDSSDLEPADVGDVADVASEVDVERVDVQVDLDSTVNRCVATTTAAAAAVRASGHGR